MNVHKLENMFNKNNLIDKINYNSLYIMNFECLKDLIIDKVRDFFTSKYEVKNHEFIGVPNEKYNKEIRTLDKDCAVASLKWLRTVEAINDFDIDTYYVLKSKRNEITHKFYNTLCDQVNIVDKTLFTLNVGLYNKIEKWFINNVEIATDEDMIGVDYDEKGIMAGQALVLQIINDAIINKDYNILDELYKKIKNL